MFRAEGKGTLEDYSVTPLCPAYGRDLVDEGVGLPHGSEQFILGKLMLSGWKGVTGLAWRTQDQLGNSQTHQHKSLHQ